MTQMERVRLLAISVVVTVGLYTCGAEGSELKYKLNLLPKSWHQGQTNATNERHKGVGLSVTLPNGITYGAMHYKNSFGDNGWMVSAAKEYEPLFGLIYPGIGMGYAPSYAKSGHEVGLVWVQLRYKWVTMMSAPGEVTAFVFSIPLN